MHGRSIDGGLLVEAGQAAVDVEAAQIQPNTVNDNRTAHCKMHCGEFDQGPHIYQLAKRLTSP
jgi:hypothetical protein